MNPTPRQKQILDFVSKHIDKRGYAPSIQEICDEFGLGSTATVHKHLKNLEARGLLNRDVGKSRAMEMPGGTDSVSVPLLGRIAAGFPIESFTVPSHADEIEIPANWLGRGERYALKVRGQSMIDAHIEDGDIVIVERRETARDGETVVALIDKSESTLKIFRHESQGRVKLEPRNSSFEPMVFEADRVEIQGVVVGVLRKYARK